MEGEGRRDVFFSPRSIDSSGGHFSRSVATGGVVLFKAVPFGNNRTSCRHRERAVKSKRNQFDLCHLGRRIEGTNQ